MDSSTSSIVLTSDVLTSDCTDAVTVALLLLFVCCCSSVCCFCLAMRSPKTSAPTHAALSPRPVQWQTQQQKPNTSVTTAEIVLFVWVRPCTMFAASTQQSWLCQCVVAVQRVTLAAAAAYTLQFTLHARQQPAAFYPDKLSHHKADAPELSKKELSVSIVTAVACGSTPPASFLRTGRLVLSVSCALHLTINLATLRLLNAVGLQHPLVVLCWWIAVCIGSEVSFQTDPCIYLISRTGLRCSHGPDRVCARNGRCFAV